MAKHVALQKIKSDIFIYHKKNFCCLLTLSSFYFRRLSCPSSNKLTKKWSLSPER